MVTLRAIEPEDLDLLYRIENDPELWGVGVTNVPYSRYVLHDFVANSAGDIYTDKQVRLIIENEQHEAVGIADLMNFSPQHLRAEVGIVVCRQQRGRGYALEALRSLQDYASRVIHLHQLYALVPASHQASVSLFERAGFNRASELADWLFDGKKYHSAVVMQLFL